MSSDGIAVMHDVKDLVIHPDYEYSIDDETFATHSISLAHIKAHFLGRRYELQPVILGAEQNIERFSYFLWKKVAKSWSKETTDELESDRFTLKKDVLIPTLASLFDASNGRIIDLGCFDGSVTLAATDSCHFDSYTGIDLVPMPMQTGRWSRGRKLQFVAGQVDQMPFSDRSFDTAISSMTLLNCVKVEAVFKELDRILERKATILIADINSNNYRASGFYHHDEGGLRFIRVLDAEKKFFTLKKISEIVPAVHCHHPHKLYSNLLQEIGFMIDRDFVKGPTVTDILELSLTTDDAEKSIERYQKEIEYPCFRLVKACRG